MSTETMRQTPGPTDPMAAIKYVDRPSGSVQTEQVYGDRFLRWAYGSALGRLTLRLAVQRLWFSRWYGRQMDRPASRKRIAPFIRDYGLDPAEFEQAPETFQSFNAFFSRRLKADARPVDPDPTRIVFPADGRHLAIADCAATTVFYAKGQRFQLAECLADAALAQRFEGGSVLISRLCPVDYHRFHFPLGGVPGRSKWLPGSLRSVSPIALRRQLSILWENRRCLTVLEQSPVGAYLSVEIGATCVGRVHQTYLADAPVSKGAEKGYFAFGGSCVITVFAKGAVTFDEDLLDHSSRGLETYARVGQAFATIA